MWGATAWGQEAELWLKFRLPVIDKAKRYERASLERAFAPLKLELREYGRGEGEIVHVYRFFMEKSRPVVELELSEGKSGKPLRQTFYYGEVKVAQKVIQLGASFEQIQKTVGLLSCMTVHPESIYNYSDALCSIKGTSETVMLFFKMPPGSMSNCKEYDCSDVDARKMLLKHPQTPLDYVTIDYSK